MAVATVNLDGLAPSVIPVCMYARTNTRFLCRCLYSSCVLRIFCMIECPDGKYGSYCLMNCTCLNGGACEKERGMCSCLPEYTGTDCETRLPTTPVPTTPPPTPAAPTCPPSHCQNGGSCAIQLGSPICTYAHCVIQVVHCLTFHCICYSCTPFWTGDRCLQPRSIPADCLTKSTAEEINLCILNADPPGELKGDIRRHFGVIRLVIVGERCAGGGDALTSNQKVSIGVGILVPLIVALVVAVILYCCYK